jgi:septum site-determining protein MinC
VNTAAPIEKKSLRFRARSFVAFALTPEAPIADWLHRLDRWTANSPGFFEGRPVVLDLSLIKPSINEAASLV